MIPAVEANFYGFDWPARAGEGAHTQVTRTATIQRGKKGTYRVLQVATEAQVLDIYISPKGRMRVFRKRKELK